MYKVLEIVSDYMHISLENLKNALKILLQSYDLHLKSVKYDTGTQIPGTLPSFGINPEPE
jgi:hypothetical protein